MDSSRGSEWSKMNDLQSAFARCTHMFGRFRVPSPLCALALRRKRSLIPSPAFPSGTTGLVGSTGGRESLILRPEGFRAFWETLRHADFRVVIRLSECIGGFFAHRDPRSAELPAGVQGIRTNPTAHEQFPDFRMRAAAAETRCD